MCRLLAYSGNPIFLETLLVKPDVSLISQARAAREAKTVVNGDGCGLGWYGEREEPGTYRGVLPAWSDANLVSLCRQLRSHLFIAHVRSATSGEVTSANCHPFSAGRHLFAHNGQIGDYEQVRRRVDDLIPDALYPLRRGTSDSEAIFLAALGRGFDTDPVAAVGETLGDIMKAVQAADGRKALRFSAVHANGDTLWAYRWASDCYAPSLYWRRFEEGIVVASEPFDAGQQPWTMITPGTALAIRADGTLREYPLPISVDRAPLVGAAPLPVAA